MAEGHQTINPGVSLAGAVDLESLKHQTDATAGQPGGAPPAGGYVIDVTSASLPAVVQTSSTFPVLLLLWVATDDRLFPMASALGEAVNKLEGKVQLARIDIADDEQIAQAFGVKGAPALFAVIKGRPIPILQGMPNDDELRQVTDTLLPQVVALARKSGVNGTAPYQGDKTQRDDDAAASGDSAVPPAHAKAHALAQAGDYSGAAVAYAKVLEADPSDTLAARERSKALLLARSGSADLRQVRSAAARHPDDLDAQEAVADVDMIGGQVDDAFNRLLDFVAAHRDQLEAVRSRLLEYFAMLEPTDSRLQRARRRLTALLF